MSSAVFANSRRARCIGWGEGKTERNVNWLCMTCWCALAAQPLLGAVPRMVFHRCVEQSHYRTLKMELYFFERCDGFPLYLWDYVQSFRGIKSILFSSERAFYSAAHWCHRTVEGNPLRRKLIVFVWSSSSVESPIWIIRTFNERQSVGNMNTNWMKELADEQRAAVVRPALFDCLASNWAAILFIF